MFSTRAAIRGFAAAAMLAPALASAAIVVASSGPSAGQFPVGRKLDDSAQITLRAGDVVTILDARGTRVLRGAGNFAVTQQTGASRASMFALLTRDRASQRVRTGAVRGEAGLGPVRSPNLWYVDLTRSGTQCVTPSGGLQLWRATASKPASFAITGLRGVGNAKVSFPVGAMVAPWDSLRLPITPGASYAIAGERGIVIRNVTFAVLPALPATPEALAAALIDRGCTAQLELLSATLAQS